MSASPPRSPSFASKRQAASRKTWIKNQELTSSPLSSKSSPQFFHTSPDAESVDSSPSCNHSGSLLFSINCKSIMTPSLLQQQRVLGSVGGLYHLVEAATALTELVDAQKQQRPPMSSNASCGAPSTKPALICDDDDRGSAKSSSDGQNRSSKKKDIFPQKLLEILSDSALTDVVSWLPHGRSFVILRPDLFCEDVLPRYLPPVDSRGSTKYPSFTRKLNRW